MGGTGERTTDDLKGGRAGQVTSGDAGDGVGLDLSFPVMGKGCG